MEGKPFQVGTQPKLNVGTQPKLNVLKTYIWDSTFPQRSWALEWEALKLKISGKFFQSLKKVWLVTE